MINVNINDEEFKKEKGYLEDVKIAIKEIIKEKKVKVEENKSIITGEKRHLWENLNEFTDPEMYSSMDEADLNVSIINSSIDKISKLERCYNSPYFGRVDFKTNQVTSFYIGLTGVERSGINYVYDWRAPISNLYYEGELGQASVETPDGIERGDILLRRQYRIVLGELKKAFDSNIALDDEILQDILLENSDSKMKNIVSTIQKEQNALIRFKKNKNLIVEGVAGSGKTSIALHRVAYLLYNNRDLTNKNVLIFSPNDIFTEYISNVLPELGEENVPTITLIRFAKMIFPSVGIESQAEFIERIFKMDSDNDDIKYKFSKEYIQDLNSFITEYVNNLRFTQKIGLKKQFISSSELNLMYTSLSKLSLSDRIYYIADKLCDLYNIDSLKNVDKLALKIRNMLCKGLNVLDLYETFLGHSINREKIDFEDVAGLLYLYFELNGYPDYSYIKHVVIDEAQDYSMLEFKILAKIFNSATFTILGDSRQVVNPYLEYKSLDFILGLLNNSEYVKITKTYRSSREIIEYSNKVLNINDIEAVRLPSDIKVMEKSSEDIKDLNEDVGRLKNLYNRVGIITKNMEEAIELNSILSSREIGLITDSILKKVVIVPSYSAKGLEFDAVIVYTGKGNKYTDRERKLYYIALTRAEHELVVYNQN